MFVLRVKEIVFPAKLFEILDDRETRSSDVVLYQNHPNPLNPATSIELVLPKSGQVKIEILNILGQKVRTLVGKHLRPGHKLVDWDGRDDCGEELSGGVYLYRIATAESSQAKKMLLLK